MYQTFDIAKRLPLKVFNAHTLDIPQKDSFVRFSNIGVFIGLANNRGRKMGNMERIDESVYDRADEGLLRLIEKAKVSALSEEEQKLYDASMKLLEDEIDMEEHGYKRGVKDGDASAFFFVYHSTGGTALYVDLSQCITRRTEHSPHPSGRMQYAPTSGQKKGMR